MPERALESMSWSKRLVLATRDGLTPLSNVYPIARTVMTIPDSRLKGLSKVLGRSGIWL